MVLGTISKAGRVLDLFSTIAPEWGVSEVSASLGMPKSSAHAVLVSLSEIGLIRRLADGRYRLGWRILELNRTLIESPDVLRAASRTTRLLAERLNATVHVAALHHDEVIYLVKAVGSRATDAAPSGVGLSAPAHCTALGKVLLASLDVENADVAIDRHGLQRRTSNTITSVGRLRDELALVRCHGVGYDVEESVNRICCVAAPVRDKAGNVQAAISASVPAANFLRHRETLRRSVSHVAAALTRDTHAHPRASGRPGTR